MKTSVWRLHLCVLAVVAVCGSGRGSPSVKKEMDTIGLPPKNIQPSYELGTTEVTCIASWKDLFFQKEAIKRAKLIPISTYSPSLLLIHIHNYVNNASDRFNSSKYCQLSEPKDECALIAVYSQTIFDFYPGALLISLGACIWNSPLVQLWQRKTIVEISWTLSIPYCSGHYESRIMKDFVYYELKSAPDNNQLVDNYILSAWTERRKSSKWNAIILYLLIISSSPAILLVLCWLKKCFLLHRQRSLNSVSRSLLFSTMLQSWVWFVYLYGYQFKGLSVFKDFLHSKSALVSTTYMPFVDIGYYAFGIMGVFYLVEFPFLLWYFSTKVMTVDRRIVNRRQCMLNMLKSVGRAGIVLFMQVASWYFMYIFIGFLSYPLFAIVLLGAYLVIFIFLIASTALLFLPCLTRCRRCPQQSVPIMVLVLITFICGGFTYLLGYAVAGKWDTSYNTSQVVSGIFASGLLALLVYTVKSVLAQNMLMSGSQVGTDELDEQMLHSA